MVKSSKLGRKMLWNVKNTLIRVCKVDWELKKSIIDDGSMDSMNWRSMMANPFGNWFWNSSTTRLAWYDGDKGGEMEVIAFVEPLVIFLILIVNAIVGMWQESNAEKALEALKEIQSEQATVIRDNEKISDLHAKELVPGDIVELKVGDKVLADMRIVRLISSTLWLEQGSLTGESEAVIKTNKPIQGKRCIVFAGITVVNGNCICLVTQIGMDTEIGKMHN